MNLYALFRLVWRPAKMRTPIGIANIAAFLVLAHLIGIVINTGHRERADGAHAALLFAAFVGLLIGQAVGELEQCSFSWTLPALHRKLAPAVVLTGVVVALAGVGFHIKVGGSYGRALRAGDFWLGRTRIQRGPSGGYPVRSGRSLGSVWRFHSASSGCDCTDCNLHRSDRSTLPGSPHPLVLRWGYRCGVVSLATL